MKRNMAEKLTASILAAVLTFGMMAPQTAMTAEAAAKSTLEKDVQKLVKKSGRNEFRRVLFRSSFFRNL